MEKTSKIWMDGKLVPWDEARVHVLTHALHYGSGVFEGIRCYLTDKGPAVFRLKGHVRRLFDSARIYQMPMPYSEKEIISAIKETIRANNIKECYIRPIAFRGYGEMGLEPSKCPVNVSIAVWPWGAYLGKEAQERGVKTIISTWARISPNVLPPFAKATANYLNSILAKQDALSKGAQEAIMLDSRGFVSEGPGENVFIVKDGSISTPGPESSILLGITRDSAIAIARDSGYEVRERDITRQELYLADEAFYTGTAVELTPISSVDGRKISDGLGPVTAEIQKKLFGALRGREKKYVKWLDFV